MLAVFSALLLASVVKAIPLARRDNWIENCYHDMAYTWDDGPYVNHDTINSIFTANDAHTTFFVNGDNWSCIYDADNVAALRQSYELGHQVAHHTWAHADLTTLSYADIDIQINRLNDAFVRILGVKPKIFRPPYGSINDDIVNYLQTNHGLTVVTWSDDSLDSDGEDTVEWNYNFYTDIANNWNGSPKLTLSHETYDWSVGALEEGTVTNLRAKGINLITVAQCLDTDPYEVVTGYYGTPDSGWYCGGDYVPMAPPTSTAPAPPAQTCATYYTTTSVTTCQAVATTFGITAAAVQSANSFVDCTDIWQGTNLCIPTIGQTTTTTTTSAATTTTTTTAAQTCATYYSAPSAMTCAQVGAVFGISANAVQAANSYVDCTDIWQGTNLCIPSIGQTSTTTTSATTTTTAAQTCATYYSAPSAMTCAQVGSVFGISANAVQAANSYVDCTDIWQGTNLCIPTIGTPTTTSTTSAAGASSPTCVQTYTAASGDTCTTIGNKFGLSANAILTANSFLNCSDIWAYTPICIPAGGSTSSVCTKTISSQAGDTCASIGAANGGVTGDQILAWNTFLTCTDIWANTPVCVSHS